MARINSYQLLLKTYDVLDILKKSKFKTYLEESYLSDLEGLAKNDLGNNFSGEHLDQIVHELMIQVSDKRKNLGGDPEGNLDQLLRNATSDFVSQTGDKVRAAKLHDVIHGWGSKGKVAGIAVMILAMTMPSDHPELAQRVMQQAIDTLEAKTPMHPNVPDKMPAAESKLTESSLSNFIAASVAPMIVKAYQAIRAGKFGQKQLEVAKDSLIQIGDSRGLMTNLMSTMKTINFNVQQQAAVVVGLAAAFNDPGAPVSDTAKVGVLNGITTDNGQTLTRILQNTQQAAPQQAQESRKIREGKLDLMHLPGDMLAWLFDRPEEQVKTAKEIGIAAAEVGNPITSGGVLRADENVLVMHCKNNCGKFHVYPDGDVSYNGEMIDGHEDVERLIGVKPEDHPEPAMARPMTQAPAMDAYAEVPEEIHNQVEVGGPVMLTVDDLGLEHDPEEDMHHDDLDYWDRDPNMVEGATADNFKKLKAKVMKKNPKAETPTLDHVIDMWNKVDESVVVFETYVSLKPSNDNYKRKYGR